MPGTMSMADLVTTLKASLMDAAGVFESGGGTQFEQMILTAADDFRRVKPNLQYDEVTLIAGQRSYALPATMGDFKYDTWGQSRKKPWETGYAGRLPRVTNAQIGGVIKLVLDPAPTQAHIDDAGAVLPFWHVVPYTIHATDGSQTTIPAVLRGLLILRAQVEALRQMAIRNVSKPVQMVEGFGNHTRNGTASFLYGALAKEFEEKAAA